MFNVLHVNPLIIVSILTIAAVTVQFIQAFDSVAEGSSLEVCTQLSGEAAIPVTVPLLVGEGSALLNTDLTISDQSFSFPAGIFESCVTILAIGDAVLEEDEAITLTLQSSDTVLITDGTIAIAITDQNSENAIIADVDMTIRTQPERFK